MAAVSLVTVAIEVSVAVAVVLTTAVEVAPGSETVTPAATH